MKKLFSFLAALAATAAAPPADAPRLVERIAQGGVVTANIDLGAEFPQMKGYVFTQTLTTVAPNTGKPWHSHRNFPEIVRILSGTLTDVRDGGPAKTYGPGSTLINAAGTEHMWANEGSEPVTFLATAIRRSN